MFTNAIVWVAAAYAGTVADLDAVPGWGGLAFEAAPRASMTRRGGNGTGRIHYVQPGESKAIDRYLADQITYEFIDNKLATVIIATTHTYDAEGLQAYFAATYGPPTWSDALTQVWRGEKVRLVWRQQSTELWIATLAWLPLHVGEADPIPEAPAATIDEPIGPIQSPPVESTPIRTSPVGSAPIRSEPIDNNP